MKYKPDWEDAKKRLTALWHGEVTDRPCLAVTAPSGESVPAPPAAATPWQRWLDPDWVVADIAATLGNTWWGGGAIPSYLVMAGWALCLGATPRLDMHTIWCENMEVDFSKPWAFRYAEDDVWVTAHAKLCDAIVEFAGKDDFLVGTPCGLPANDVLAQGMGVEAFLLASVDHAEWMREAIVAGAREQIRICLALQDRIGRRHDFWYGNSGWMPFWAPEPFVGTQSDMSCMLSPEMFERFIVPELEMRGEAQGPLWYHLDGGDAVQHLPRLLSLPYLRVMQYVPAPFEPASEVERLELYRQMQAGGKIVHLSVPKEYVEPLYRQLDPALLILQTACDSMAEGQALLDASKHWL